MSKIGVNKNGEFSILEAAFRPFFILAAISSLFYMILWTAVYTFRLNLNFENITPTMWHAHEMLFGYTMAVVAGFLLTVEKYWLGVVINRIYMLVLLIALWVLARIAISLTLFSNFPFVLGAVLDCLFMIGLLIRVSCPIISARAWGKMGLVAHVAIIAISNIAFYLGVFGVLSKGQYWGVYSALYLIISLILLMGRKMIPIFIRNGLDFAFEPRNWRLIDILSLVIFLLFFFFELFSPYKNIVNIISGVLAVIFSIRLYGWYSNKLWRKPLLWVLFVGYSWIVIGFGLKFLSMFFSISDFLSIHSFTYGSIGIMTIGFMSRVILGHTGRNVFDPPKILFWIFAPLTAGAFVRVFCPIFDSSQYLLWIAISQFLWIVSFLIFSVVYIPMLLRPAIEKES